MVNNDEILIKYIQKKLMNKMTFDLLNVSGGNIKLTNKEYIEISKESIKYGISKSELNKLIQDSIDKMSLGPRIEDEFKIIPEDLILGQHIKLFTDDGNGTSIEELIFIGKGRFILIKHERGSLLVNDQLKSVTSPWNIGGYIDFEVYREDKRIIHKDKYSIYRTRKITKIQLMFPQFDYDAIDQGELNELEK